MKLKKADLYTLNSLATDNYKTMANHGLEEPEFKAVCYIEAVLMLLKLDIKVQYPYPSIIEPDED